MVRFRSSPRTILLAFLSYFALSPKGLKLLQNNEKGLCFEKKYLSSRRLLDKFEIAVELYHNEQKIAEIFTGTKWRDNDIVIRSKN